ncbi:hypothetical protein SAMN02990966_03932 [Rhodospirillales bacterium URHD0017]|nr:hypothetical protein SAMN02990966_03932 [Rhodospirillales bacterium URHD0017]
MILGMSLSTFTVVHVVLSLVGIASGVLVLLRPSASPTAWGLTTLFLVTTLAASVTGLLFLLPFPRFGLGHGIGVASLLVFVPTLLALWRHRLAGAPLSGIGRATYVAGAATLLYLNAFIAVMQAFGKIGYLSALPVTSLGSPLFLAHLLVLAISVWLAIHAFARLQSGGASRLIRARALRVADRWN